MKATDGGSTVFSRMKKTGYMLGPRHAMSAAFDAKALAPAAKPPLDSEPDADDPDEASESEPPNLRDSIDSAESCGLCEYFDAQGTEDGKPKCSKFNDYPVTANQVCDAFEQKVPDDAKEALDQPEGDVSNDHAAPGM